MLIDEAKLLLGFPTNSCPNASQVKAAYRRKVWETHPDCFPDHLKPNAELKFKMISEAYTCLLSGARQEGEHVVGYSRVVRSGVPRGGGGGRRNHALIGLPFLFIILGTAALGGTNVASRSLRPCHVDPPKTCAVWMNDINAEASGIIRIVPVGRKRNQLSIRGPAWHCINPWPLC